MTDNRQQSGAPAWTVVAVFMALGALFALTGFVTGAYRSERRSMAEQHYRLGKALARQEEFQRLLTGAAPTQLVRPTMVKSPEMESWHVDRRPFPLGAPD